MKILRWLFALVMLMTATEALATGHSVPLYYGVSHDILSTMGFSLKIMMPSGVYVGEYKSEGILYGGDYLENISWNGPPPAPSVKLTNYDSTVNTSFCPGLPSGWGCGFLEFEVIVSADIESYFSCP